MGFPKEPAIHPIFAQMIAQGVFTNPQWKVVPLRPVAGCIAARVKTHAAGPANGGLHIGICKPNTH